MRHRLINRRGEIEMIRWITARARIGLVVAAMTASVPMIAFAQTSEPAIESVPTEAEVEEVNANPMGDDMSEGTEPPARSAIPAEVDVEFQRLFTELRSDLLDGRADTVDWWLAALAVVLGFFASSDCRGWLHRLRFIQFRRKSRPTRKAVS